MVYADATECYVQWMNMCECLSSMVGKLKKEEKVSRVKMTTSTTTTMTVSKYTLFDPKKNCTSSIIAQLFL